LGIIENQLTDRLLYYTVGCVAALASLYMGPHARAGTDEDQYTEQPSADAEDDADQPRLQESRR
jgi:hypothetical protein